MTDFKFLKNRKENSEKYVQDFTDSKNNYSLTQYGEKFNLYERIQKAREDTEIIPTIEKYGIAKGLEKLKRYDETQATKYYGDFRAITEDFRNLLDQQKAANDMWLSLPLDIRAKFGHSQREFMEKGGAWLKSESEKLQAKITKEQTIEQPSVSGETKTTPNTSEA